MFTLQLRVPAGLTECNAVASFVNLLPNVTKKGRDPTPYGDGSGVACTMSFTLDGVIFPSYLWVPGEYDRSGNTVGDGFTECRAVASALNDVLAQAPAGIRAAAAKLAQAPAGIASGGADLISNTVASLAAAALVCTLAF